MSTGAFRTVRRAERAAKVAARVESNSTLGLIAHVDALEALLEVRAQRSGRDAIGTGSTTAHAAQGMR